MEDKPPQGVNQLLLAIIGVLATATTGLAVTSFGAISIVIAIPTLVAVFLGYFYWFEREKNKNYLLDTEEKNRHRELFLKNLIDSRAIIGHDVLVNRSSPFQFDTTFKTGSRLEMFTFSQKRFALVMLDKTNMIKLKAELAQRDVEINLDAFEKLGIKTLACHDNITQLKFRTVIPSEGEWSFIFLPMTEAPDEKILIYYVISNIPHVPGARQTIPNAKKPE